MPEIVSSTHCEEWLKNCYILLFSDDLLLSPLPFSVTPTFVNDVQRSSTSLISSMGHTITEGLTLEITSMNMLAMIVITACTTSSFLLLLFLL